MSRAQEIKGMMYESYRGAYQVLITPMSDSVMVRFADDSIGNDHLRFPPVTLSHQKFFELVAHEPQTRATFDLALERGDTYGLFVNPWAVSRLARAGQPGDPNAKEGTGHAPTKYHHTHSRQEPSDMTWARHGMMTGRV